MRGEADLADIVKMSLAIETARALGADFRSLGLFFIKRRVRQG